MQNESNVTRLDSGSLLTPLPVSPLPEPRWSRVGGFLLSSAAAVFIATLMWFDKFPKEDMKWAVLALATTLLPVSVVERLASRLIKKLPGGK